MTSKAVIENILHFFNEILSDAHVRNNWNAISIERALKWAIYCTKVYDSCADKSFAALVNDILEKKLNANILQLESYLQSSGNSHLQLLQCSPEILCKMLFENPYLDEPSFQCIINFCTESAKPILQSEEFLEFICKKANHIILLNSLENIYSSNLLNKETEDTNSAVFVANYCFCLLLKNEFQDEKIFDILEKLSFRMDIILHLLIVKYTDNLTNTRLLQGKILSWIIENLERLSSKLWTQSSSLLCSVSAEHYKFYELYIQFLIQEGNALFPDHPSQGQTRTNSEKMKSRIFSYDEVVHRFKELAVFSCNLSKVTVDLLNCLCINSGCSIWLDVKTQIYIK